MTGRRAINRKAKFILALYPLLTFEKSVAITTIIKLVNRVRKMIYTFAYQITVTPVVCMVDPPIGSTSICTKSVSTGSLNVHDGT